MVDNPVDDRQPRERWLGAAFAVVTVLAAVLAAAFWEQSRSSVSVRNVKTIAVPVSSPK